jgi:hypothetical protein
LSTRYDELVEEWLSRLNELQPADGKLTAEIMAAVGPFPVYKPPGDAYDNRNDPVKSQQHFEGSTARVYARERAQHNALMAKTEVNALYWSQIVAWLKTIQ